ncbi:cytochrome P450 family protein [Scytonema sp. HK-05]|uniref:cytochrome P450 n=1 Tax=Scytonema sp. HK-05 TaxID=1137095 RepID=UPI00093609E3|nr:cytochrome P450 [Scytonema sp. HK-05]OKH52751.1 cytochrome P450 [Scytonema sp. HK-05]BAY43580.1 cytochrome P450 family protein [Scytonema sp. HK-05]
MIALKENSLQQTANKLPNRTREPGLLQTIWAIVRPLDYLETMQERYGDIFSTDIPGFRPQVIISNPQAIQEIFTADSKLFESGSGSEVIEPLLGSNSLILLDGERHMQQRKLLMPPFHGERMRAYGQLISDIAKQVISQWKIGDVFKARSSMQEISLTVILRAVFGLKEGERYQQIRKTLTAMLDSFESPLSATLLFFKTLQHDLGPLSPWGNFVRQRELLDKLLYQEIRERRAQSESLGEDILSLLLSVRDEAGQPMTDIELRDELMTMLFAGHETTATALAWALYWVHYIPEVREKLLQELNSINVANADPMEISRLPYLNAVCSETLRIYPVVFFALPRILQAPMQLMGYDLPKGMLISPCIYLTHHRPDIYPEPKQFKPERFLERQFYPYEYLPFGGGNRRCLGLAFAMFEMKLVLATVLSDYSLELAERRPLLPVRRGITFAPPGGVPLVVKGRN